MELNIDKTGWKKVKFGEVCRQVNETARNPQEEGLLHVVGLEHIGSNDLHIRSWNTLERETTFTRKFVKGQVLFGRRRAYQAKVAYAEFDGICSGDILVFEAIKSKLLPELLPFIVQSQKFYNKAVETSAGSLSPRTKFKDLADLEFLLPPKEQQARLAELLWAADEVVEREMEVKEKSNDLFYKILNSYFEETRMPLKKLSEVAKIIMGQSPDGASYNEKGDGMLFLQGNSEFTEQYPKAYKYTNQPNKIARTGDILMSVRAPVGAINIADKEYCIGRGLCSISLLEYHNDYLRYFLIYSRELLEKQSTGSTFKAVNRDIIQNLLIPIGQDINSVIETLKRCENAYQVQKEQIAISIKLKQGLINEIFY